MGSRLDLHAIFKAIPGVVEVYFQPPDSRQLLFPCIIYSRDMKDEKFANNELYAWKRRYLVTIVDKNPDSSIPDLVARLPLTSFSRHYRADNLNHDVYSIYF